MWNILATLIKLKMYTVTENTLEITKDLDALFEKSIIFAHLQAFCLKTCRVKFKV